jgi:hypothetical protein
MGNDRCEGEFEEGVPRLLFNPLIPPLLLRLIFDLGGLKKRRLEGHPQTPGSVPLHHPGAYPTLKKGDSGGFRRLDGHPSS